MSSIEDFIQTITVGNIYWFVNPQISSPEPHPHVCLGLNDEDCVFMLCGTSQFENKRRYFELNGLPSDALVRLQKNVANTLAKDTFVDCNDIQTHDIGDLYYDIKITLRGRISDSELLQIKSGIENSDLLELGLKKEILACFPAI